MHHIVTGLGRELDHEPVQDESTKELLSEFVAEGKRLLREEANLIRLEAQTLVAEGRQRLERDVAVAKDEISTEAKRAVRAGSAIGAGGILAQAALYLVLFAVVFGLAKVMPLWAASFIVGALTAGGAAFLIFGGLKRIKLVRLTPQRTVARLKEDGQWMKEKMHAMQSTIPWNG